MSDYSAMRPPPRKDKNVALAFKKLNESQVSCFAKKHQLELEFVNKIKLYCKQRGEIELVYAETLDRLSQQCQLQEVLTHESGYGNRSLYAVWNNYLEDSQKAAQCHVDVAKFITDNVAENLKSLLQAKMTCAKRAFERLQKDHQETQNLAKNLDRSKRDYHTAFNQANELTKKARQTDEKIQSKQFGIFASPESLRLEKEKFSHKAAELYQNASDKRNQYILQLELLKRETKTTAEKEVCSLAQYLERDVYGQVWTYLSSAILIEKELRDRLCHSIASLNTEIQQALSPEEHTKAFLTSSDFLAAVVDCPFEPPSSDTRNTAVLQVDETTEKYLLFEAQKWKSAIQQHRTALTNVGQRVSLLEDLYAKAYEARNVPKKSASPATATPSSLYELYKEMESYREMARREQVALDRAEYMAQFLKDSGLNMDDSHQRYSSISLMDLPIDRRYSELSLSSSTTSSDYANLGKQYYVLYNYQAVFDDELSLNKGETLMVIENPMDAQWPKGQNDKGECGLVPANYITAVDPATPSYLTVDRPVHVPPPLTPKPALLCPKPHFEMKGHSSSQLSSPTYLPPKLLPKPKFLLNRAPSEETLNYDYEALIDYTSVRDGELSFRRGDRIAVTSQRPNGIDDGFWTGVCDGKRGNFASLMVRRTQPS